MDYGQLLLLDQQKDAIQRPVRVDFCLMSIRVKTYLICRFDFHPLIFLITNLIVFGFSSISTIGLKISLATSVHDM